jgi:hypothetical protein
MDADVEAVKSRVAAEARDQLESGGFEIELLRDFADFMLPESMTVTESAIEGKRAVLSATGVRQACSGSETSEGSIEMIRERGDWKVAKVSWGD